MDFKVCWDKKPQKTLKMPFKLTAKMPFSGRTGRIFCLPAPPDTGIVFMVEGKIIPAKISSLVLTSQLHTTILRQGGVSLFAPEHLLAAFAGLGINNVKVQIEGGCEVPAPDAGASTFTEKILKSGLIAQTGSNQALLEIQRPFLISVPGGEGFAYFLPFSDYEVCAVISFPNLIGQQAYEVRINPDNFRKELCWARSFIRSPLDKEGEKWKDIRQKIKSLPKDPKKSPLIVFDSKKYINPLVTPDEPVRHKILDFLGDFSLLGYSLKGKVILHKLGHDFNHYLVKNLKHGLISRC